MKTLEDMKEKKIIRLIHVLEEDLEKPDQDISDYVLQEAAIQHLTKKGWDISYIAGTLVIKKKFGGKAK